VKILGANLFRPRYGGKLVNNANNGQANLRIVHSPAGKIRH